MPSRCHRQLRKRQSAREPESKESGIIYYVSFGFKWLTITVLLVLFAHIFLDLLRKLAREKKEKGSDSKHDGEYEDNKRMAYPGPRKAPDRSLKKSFRRNRAPLLPPRIGADQRTHPDREIGERIKLRFEELKEQIFVKNSTARRRRRSREAVSAGEIFYRFGVNIQGPALCPCREYDPPHRLRLAC